MKLSQIKKKCPKAYQMFYEAYRQEAGLLMNVRDAWRQITDFMDRQGIFISTNIYTTNNAVYCEIYFNKKGYEFESLFTTDDYKTRSQSETKAIEKAFEILEGRSEE